ncbi:hypothetical protein ACFFMN_23285 [Planobispora siamensis]|uniref:Uncharacterized protein n=1 Tax=Planobispora siamensis TaxID=936338 RepID=A0A8J3SMH0_9ACTN|nr:hypothetical protein [Planobispora siamensis]GIH95286.1 hypothetical protein Psi01_59160 [Planobispora siamensis]
MTATAGTREYCRTFSATTKHVINPDKPGKTLCGRNVMSKCAGILPHMRDMYYGLPTCEGCETSATKRGLVEGPEIYREYAPKIIRYVERFTGTACIVHADYPHGTLCGVGINDDSERRADTGGLPVCTDCQTSATEEGYYHADEQTAASANDTCTETTHVTSENANDHDVQGDAPEVVTWALTSSSADVRHIIDPHIPAPADGHQQTLCGATGRHTHPSRTLEPWSPWARTTVCRRCDATAKTRGMVTQDQLSDCHRWTICHGKSGNGPAMFVVYAASEAQVRAIVSQVAERAGTAWPASLVDWGFTVHREIGPTLCNHANAWYAALERAGMDRHTYEATRSREQADRAAALTAAPDPALMDGDDAEAVVAWEVWLEVEQADGSTWRRHPGLPPLMSAAFAAGCSAGRQGAARVRIQGQVATRAGEYSAQAAVGHLIFMASDLLIRAGITDTRIVDIYARPITVQEAYKEQEQGHPMRFLPLG